MKKAILTAIAAATLTIVPATAQAVPIVGSIDLVGSVRITGDTIDWLTGGLPGGPTGEAFVLASSGYFDGLGFGSGATELDLSGIPIGVSGQLVDGFETFEDMPGVNFILDTILSCGQSSLNPAVECLLGPASAFAFVQDQQGTVVVMNFNGFVVDSDNPDPDAVATFDAKFSATFLGKTPLDILVAFQTQGFIDAPYSAQKITAEIPTEVPEPATMLTFGAGTALLAAHRRRRAKKAAK
jgi:hypothetical protein